MSEDGRPGVEGTVAWLDDVRSVGDCVLDGSLGVELVVVVEGLDEVDGLGIKSG